MAKILEKHILSACLQWLAVKGYFAWRNNVGAYKINDGSGRFIRYGLKGSPDIIAIGKDGKFIGIECKAGKNDQTVEQMEFESRIKANKGIYIVAYSIYDLERELKL